MGITNFNFKGKKNEDLTDKTIEPGFIEESIREK